MSQIYQLSSRGKGNRRRLVSDRETCANRRTQSLPQRTLRLTEGIVPPLSLHFAPIQAASVVPRLWNSASSVVQDFDLRGSGSRFHRSKRHFFSLTIGPPLPAEEESRVGFCDVVL